MMGDLGGIPKRKPERKIISPIQARPFEMYEWAGEKKREETEMTVSSTTPQIQNTLKPYPRAKKTFTGQDIGEKKHKQKRGT